MSIDNSFLFAKTHEWVKKESDGTILVGISDHAQSEMGDLVYISLPEAGEVFKAGEVFAEIESVKAVSSIYAPASGVILEVNSSLLDSPEKLNEAPYESWMIRIGEVAELIDLLNAAQYVELINQKNI